MLRRLALVLSASLAVLSLAGASQAAPVAPSDVQAAWVGLHTLQLTWSQHSEANRATVTRCGASGGSCYLVAVIETAPGRISITDRFATGGDTYRIGEFISQADGGLRILGWTGPYRVPDHLTFLSVIGAGPAH